MTVGDFNTDSNPISCVKIYKPSPCERYIKTHINACFNVGDGGVKAKEFNCAVFQSWCEAKRFKTAKITLISDIMAQKPNADVKKTIPEDAIERAVENAPPAPLADDEISDEEMPFPNATVVRHIKTYAPNKMISSKVKVALNHFLGDVVKVVAKDMGKTRYSMIEMDDFQRATKPYTVAEDLEFEKQRIVAQLEKTKMDIEGLIRDFNRKFKMQEANEFHVIGIEDGKLADVEAGGDIGAEKKDGEE